MPYRKSLLLFATIALLLATAESSRSQSSGDPLKACESQTTTFDTWAACLIDKVATPIVNQRHPANQVEVPSIADNTTSLVDQTSAPDLVGLALNLAGLKSNSDQAENGNSGTITTSAYALYAAAKGRIRWIRSFTRPIPICGAFHLRTVVTAAMRKMSAPKVRAQCSV